MVVFYSFVNVDGIKSSIRLHNLKKYTTYFVWLSASTSVGTGPMSSKNTFSTAEDGECMFSFELFTEHNLCPANKVLCCFPEFELAVFGRENFYM